MNSTNSWKMKARTGGIRRKLSKEYQRIMKTEEIKPSSREVTQSVTNSLKQDGSVQNISRNSSEDVVHSTNYVCPSSSSSNLGDNINCSTGNYNSEKISSSEDDDDGNYSDDVKHSLFREKIRTWAVEKSINHVALKDLAAIINDLIPQILPTDPRTILATPRNVNIKEIEGGEYWHNGIANSVIKILNSWDEAPDEISLNINFDGLPIFKSSKHEFWPILCNIHENTGIKPFIIGIYFGVGKPKNLDSYLEDFINDMKKILDEGIHIFEKTIAVKIRCFICDSPARAYIKGVCNFNGKHGCLKCVTIGEYSHNSHTVTFSDIDCAERTNEGFRNKLYGPHHKTDSPLLGLPIDMVKNFPVGDSLHLLDLGIMKRLLVGWRDGNFGKYITKWRASDIETVSVFLRRCKLPSEIHRAVRALDTLAYWKASEFRSFFYYLSVIILPEVLKSTAYSHFLTLYCGIVICSSEAYQNMLPLADKLLKHFVRHYRDFYGADYVTSNVHNLIHVTAEVTMYGPLQSFNAYPFENQLYMIKKMLRVGRNPLSQVAKRLAELNFIDVNKNIAQNNSKYPFVKTSTNGRKILHMKEYKLSSKTCDRYILTTNNDIIEIKFIIEESDFLVHGTKIQNKNDIFTYPVKSSRFGIYKATSSEECANAAVILELREIKCKLVCIKHKECHYFIPLLHTL